MQLDDAAALAVAVDVVDEFAVARQRSFGVAAPALGHDDRAADPGGDREVPADRRGLRLLERHARGERRGGPHDAGSGRFARVKKLATLRGALAAGIVCLLVVPAAATGDVLVNAIVPSTVACGKAVKLGVWYQSASGGPRWAQMSVKNSHGRVVWRRNVTATPAHWRYWRYKGRCGARYVAVDKTAGGTVSFHFHVKRK
jgi:hypothetical protein